MLWQTAYKQTLLDKWTSTCVNKIRTQILYIGKQMEDCSWLEIYNAHDINMLTVVFNSNMSAIEVLASRLVNQKPWHIKYSIIITINL